MTIKVGDTVRWNSHGSHAEGRVVKIAHEDGEVSGFQYRATKDYPRYIVEVDGKKTAHTEDALSKV